MTQCLCVCPSVAPFVILDALTLASELGQKYAIINYPSQGTPICRLITAQAENLRTRTNLKLILKVVFVSL